MLLILRVERSKTPRRLRRLLAINVEVARCSPQFPRAPNVCNGWKADILWRRMIATNFLRLPCVPRTKIAVDIELHGK